MVRRPHGALARFRVQRISEAGSFNFFSAPNRKFEILSVTSFGIT